MFDSWNGFNLLCPDIKKDEQDFELYNAEGALHTKYVVFQIEKCANSTIDEGS